ncbi:MAG: HNH endonuclease, partial [Acetanaerobacterium sp.]
MIQLNEELNPNRMTPSVREKIRKARLNTGDGKTYTKRYGRHEHRIVAESLLGRPLRKGEVV